jgi:hypothetical protein
MMGRFSGGFELNVLKVGDLIKVFLKSFFFNISIFSKLLE